MGVEVGRIDGGEEIERDRKRERGKAAKERRIKNDGREGP